MCGSRLHDHTPTWSFSRFHCYKLLLRARSRTQAPAKVFSETHYMHSSTFHIVIFAPISSAPRRFRYRKPTTINSTTDIKQMGYGALGTAHVASTYSVSFSICCLCWCASANMTCWLNCACWRRQTHVCHHLPVKRSINAAELIYDDPHLSCWPFFAMLRIQCTSAGASKCFMNSMVDTFPDNNMLALLVFVTPMGGDIKRSIEDSHCQSNNVPIFRTVGGVGEQ